MNLSQIKREKMMAFLKKLKEENSGKEENLIAINEIENELNNKKYGLVWEEHEENVDKMMEENVPVFVEDKKREIKTSEDEYNFLLEGDNLHSLYLLEKTHKGKIDVIYIDPPYNTGKKDFTYDDNIVGEDDAFKHSKWLSFMHNRLKIAKGILTKSGVLIISIDNNEVNSLKLLCDDIIGSNNYLGNLIIQTATDNNPTQINTEHEYMLIYANDKESQDAWYSKSQGAQLIQEQFEILKSKYKTCEEIEKELKKWIKTNANNLKQVAHYNNVDERGVYSSSSNSSNPHPGGYTYDIFHPITKKPCPKPANGWRWKEETFLEYDRNGDVAWGKDDSTQPHIKKRLETAKAQLKSIIYADNRKTTSDLASMIGKNQFDNPKSTEVLKYVFGFCSKKDSIFLDFFAGSGTTAQAVLELNKEDGGNRHFILCTNNENNICEDVTYKRIKTVITGLRDDGSKYSDGIPANLKYYKTGFVKKDTKNLSRDLSKHIKELIQLENGVDIDNDKWVMILTEEDAEKFEKNIKKYKNLKGVYRARSVVWTKSQKVLLKGKEDHIIPDYYFNNELKEVGENW